MVGLTWHLNKYEKLLIWNMNIKKAFYIFSFVMLGMLLQFLVHAGLEIWYIELLTKDFSTYSLGFSWPEWYLIHHVASVILLALGIGFGLWQGKLWWRKLYEEPGTKKIKQ